MPPHRSGDVVVGHWQTPTTQVWAEGHAVVHTPQWVASLATFAQVPPQFVSGAVHDAEQAKVPASP